MSIGKLKKVTTFYIIELEGDDVMNITIADRIKEVRTSKHVSQTDLARKAGYSDKSAISKIEHSGDNITIKQVKRIAAALNITPSYLMGWDSDSSEAIDKITDSLSSISTPMVNGFVDNYRKDPVFMENIELLFSLPKERKTEVYKFIQYQYYQSEEEQRKKDDILDA